MFILTIDPAKILTSEIKKTISQEAKDPDSALLKSLGSLKTSPVLEIIETFPPAPGTLGSPPFVADPNPVVCSDPIPSPLPTKPRPEQLFGEIIDLANEYIIYAQNLQKFFKEHPLMSVTLLPPPWEQSNKLFEDLAQYTGVPTSEEKINNVKSFFNDIINDKPTDPNQDGKLDYNDVLAIWGGSNGGGAEPVTKGDINGDGKVDQADVDELRSAVATISNQMPGDMNGDYKLDQKDYEILKKIIGDPESSKGRPLGIIPSWHPLVGDLNFDGVRDQKDLDILGKVLKAGDMDDDGKVDGADLKILSDLVNGLDPLTTIKDLSKGLLEDPYHHLIEIPELGKALAKYTNTEYDLGKADQLFNFFLRDKSDLTGDGVIDYQDVVVFWKNLDKPQMPEFPRYVSIDLDNDGTNDYSIVNGKIYHGQEEVDSIPGIDLQTLSDEIKEKFDEGGQPISINFDKDINGDGKIDHINAMKALILLKPTSNPMPRPPFREENK